MTTYYFMNLAGATLSEEQLEEVPAARFELYTHITIKTTQAGAIIGSFLTAPIYGMIRGPRDVQSIVSRISRHGKRGFLVGLALGPIMTFAKMRGSEYEGYYDRSYRLRKNRTQVMCDRMSIVGAVAGLGAAKIAGEALGKYLFVGYAGGCLLGAVINMVAK